MLVRSVLLITILSSLSAKAATAVCPEGVDPKASTALSETSATNCKITTLKGYSMPDPVCTPGAINPTITVQILKGGQFKTGCERNAASSPAQKNKIYTSYKVAHPAKNTGKTQTCELDHLVSLELGGADTLDNIWPQCGPKRAALAKRYFKIKDGVENYLAVQVRQGAIPLTEAQHGIASNWTQYIDAASSYWESHSEKGFGSDQ